MTQEFVAETLGVSRQAVSKWENGSSDPSTSNLMALAKLYGTTAEKLLSEIQGNTETIQPFRVVHCHPALIQKKNRIIMQRELLQSQCHQIVIMMQVR